jgi:hypothetical protein
MVQRYLYYSCAYKSGFTAVAKSMVVVARRTICKGTND